jgi:hypothetical protein
MGNKGINKDIRIKMNQYEEWIFDCLEEMVKTKTITRRKQLKIEIQNYLAELKNSWKIEQESENAKLDKREIKI